MNLTDSDLKAIQDAVAEQLRTQFEKGCLCGLKPQALNEMGHFWGMMADVSEGDPGKSVEVLRKVINTHNKVERVSGKAMLVVVTVIVVAATNGMVDWVKSIWSVVKRAVP